MLVLHDETGKVTGLQTLPETSKRPHIVVDDSMFDTLNPIQSKITLVEGENGWELPPLDDAKAAAEAEELAAYKREKKDQINRESHEQLQSVTYNGNTIQTRDNGRDLFRINNEVTKAKADSTYEKEWIDIDNNTVMLTNADWIALGDAIAQQEEDVVLAARKAKDAVLSATDKASVDAVNWRSYL